MLPFEDTLADQALDDAIGQVQSDVSSEKEVLEAMGRLRERIACGAASARPVHQRRLAWRRRMTRIGLIAAAAVALVLLLPMSSRREPGPGPGIVWAEVIKAFDAARNVHAVQTMYVDGKEKTEDQAWRRRPDCYRSETADYAVIDNGRDRLTIDRKARTAAWADSPMPYGSNEPDWLERTINVFREKSDPDLVFTRLDKESTPALVAYQVTGEEVKDITAKVWVHSDSLLIDRMEWTRREQAGTGETKVQTARFTFSYEPIPDEVFVPKVPEGFKEIPRPPRRTVSGRVVDSDGRGVAKADVYLAGPVEWCFSGGVSTGEIGEFGIQLPPELAPTGYVDLPAFVRAFRPDDPTAVAWTVLRRPYDKTEPAGEIPGQPGKLECAPQSGQQRLASATDMVLTLEPAMAISGTVTDSKGKAIAGAEVRVAVALFDKLGNNLFDFELGGPGKGGKATTRTDERGCYRLTHLPVFCKGSWLRVTASAPGFTASHRKLVMGEEWSKDAVNLSLCSAEWTITGRLVDERGKPIEKRSVVAEVPGGEVGTVWARTDKDGRFRLERCPSSPKLQVRAELSQGDYGPGGPAKTKEPWFYLDVVRDIKPVAGQAAYQVELVAERPNLQVSVQVKNSQGEPLPHFLVEVRGKGITLGWQWAKFKARTDEKGRVTFKEVPRADDLHMRLDAYGSILGEQLAPAVAETVKTYRERYTALVDVPIELEPGKTNYEVEATAMSHEEWKSRRR